jgi:hypothetical protein
MAKKKKATNSRPFATSSIPKKEVLLKPEEIPVVSDSAITQKELPIDLKEYVSIQDLMNQKAIQINKQEQLKKSPNPISITLNSDQQKLIIQTYKFIQATYREYCLVYFRLLGLGFDLKIVKEAMKKTCTFEDSIGFILLNYDRKELPKGWGENLFLQRSSTEEFVGVSESDLENTDFIQVAQDLNVIELDDFEIELDLDDVKLDINPSILLEEEEKSYQDDELSQYDLGSSENKDIQTESSMEFKGEDEDFDLFIVEDQVEIEPTSNTIIDIKNLEFNWTGSDVCTLFFEFVKEKPTFNVKQVYRNGFKATLILSPHLKTLFDPLYSKGIDVDFLATTKNDAKDATAVIYN